MVSRNSDSNSGYPSVGESPRRAIAPTDFGEDAGAGGRSSPRVQFPRFAVQLLCSVQSDDAPAVPLWLSCVQLVHFTELKHAAQHAAIVLHSNDAPSLPLLEQHVPLVVCKLPHDAVLLTAAAAAPVMSSVRTSASCDRMPRKVKHTEVTTQGKRQKQQ